MGGKIPRPWTVHGIKQFQKLVGKRSAAQIAAMLDRTKGAITEGLRPSAFIESGHAG